MRPDQRLRRADRAQQDPRRRRRAGVCDAAEGGRAGGYRGRQRGRGRGHAARHHRGQRTRLEHGVGRGARDRAAAGAGPQHPAGARRAGGRPLGALALRRRGAVRKDAGRARLRPHRPAGRRPRPRPRHAGDRARPVRHPGALPGGSGHALHARAGAGRRRVHLAARPADGRHASPDPGRDDRPDAARRADRECRPRRPDRPGRAGGGAQGRPGGGRRAGRVPDRALHRRARS